jgi:hypothetical protein
MIFSHKGPTIFDPDSRVLAALVALMNSSIFKAFVELQVSFGSYEVGAIQACPIPELEREITDELADLGTRAWFEKMSVASASLTSSQFVIPALLIGKANQLEEGIDKWREKIRLTNDTLNVIQSMIDALTLKAYALNLQPSSDSERDSSVTSSVSYGEEEQEEEKIESLEASTQVASLVDYMFGQTLGRWDIRYATGERQPPELPAPFDPLPVCPPGMLQNTDGLPAAPADVSDDYPLRITWPGILVDDDGHTDDIVARVCDALTVIWRDRASAIEQEACDILGVRTLRDYFAEKKSGGKFFKDHLKRYSKSRRQAPIYWPLSTESGTYTLWIYYHRLDDQTLYSCVNNFMEPKLELTVNELSSLRSKTGRSSQEEKQMERLSDLEAELKDFRDELLRLAKFWKPNLNDGVQITAAPLWSLFRDKAWQKKLKQTWQSLEKGDYDWAHLAGSIWPERVLRKCHEDRSLAIAHGVEDDLWIEQKTYTKKGAKTEWKPKPFSESEISTWIETQAAEMRR